METETNSSEIKIRAKKISELNNVNSDFSINQFGKFAYLLLAYKDNNSLPQNFKISLEQLSEAILNKHGALTIDEIEFIRHIMNNGDFTYQEDVDITTNDSYIFTYALESDFSYDSLNNLIINSNINNLQYTQFTRGTIPVTSGINNHGFTLKDYNNNVNNYAFVWDEHVVEGTVWIVVPSNFYDRETNSFLDNNSHKYKICDAMIKQPIEPVNVVTTMYNNIPYTLFCFSTNGAIGNAYFKKIT